MRCFTALRGAVLVLSLILLPLPGASDTALDPSASRLLKQMSEKLVAATDVTFHINGTFDVVDDTGLMIQTGIAMDVAFRRPDRLMVQSFDDDSGQRGFRYDGRDASIFHQEVAQYSTVRAATTIDETLDLLADKYGFVFPVGDIINDDPYSVLLDGVTEGYYLGLTLVDGVPCHQLVFREEDIDWQIWIEDGMWQRPRKFLITYRQIEGSPQYTAYFSDWNYGTSLPDRMFAIDPPEGAKKIRWMEVAE